jgi:hypothetical protein
MKDTIEDKVKNDLIWLIIDILEENDIYQRTDDMIINGEDLEEGSWEWGYSVYKDDPNGVIDKIRIKVKSVSKFNKVLSELKLEKERIENILGYKILIEPIEPTYNMYAEKTAVINIKIRWKSLSNKIDDFKSFIKFIKKSI